MILSFINIARSLGKVSPSVFNTSNGQRTLQMLINGESCLIRLLTLKRRSILRDQRPLKSRPTAFYLLAKTTDNGDHIIETLPRSWLIYFNYFKHTCILKFKSNYLTSNIDYYLIAIKTCVDVFTWH